MPGIDALDLDLVVLFAAILGTALLARRTQLPITAVEIVAGILLVSFLGFQVPAGTDFALVLGGLFIVFLAGFETGFGFLRTNLRSALTVGLAGFLGPFVGLFVLFLLVLHAPLLIAVIGAAALADTSISITYTTLQQFELTDLPYGRLVLASTLCVNLAEDSTVTTATLASTPGLLFTIGMLGALTLAALLLPRIAAAVEDPDRAQFANTGARALLLSLAVLALLSALVGVPGILFVFLMGLIFSQLLPKAQWSAYLDKVRPLAFAVFIPIYFVAVGLKVDAPFVLANWGWLVVLAIAATALKIGSLFPVVRAAFGRARAGPVAVLMNARLTSATVVLSLTLGLGLITVAWYSLLITTVVVLAIGSSVAVRGFEGFRNAASARALFGASARDHGEADASALPVGSRHAPPRGVEG